MKHIVTEQHLSDFKSNISNSKVLEEASSPLFLATAHEDDIFPDQSLTFQEQRRVQQQLSPLTVKFVPKGKGCRVIRIGNVSESRGLYLDLDEQIVYDERRRGIRAKDHPQLDKICRNVFSDLMPGLTKMYAPGTRYHDYKEYNGMISSALLTDDGSERQSVHCDTDSVEARSALVAMNGSFKLVILRNSVRLIRRIAEIRAQWIRSGSLTPPHVDPKDYKAVEAWFDDACYAQLRKEGWGSSILLEAYTVTVDEGDAIIFSTWLMHCGCEYMKGDIKTFNRIHYYLLPYLMKKDLDYVTVNMHRTQVDPNGLVFSCALHFLPRPDVLPPVVKLPCLFGLRV
jgi:hypothetical protein